MLLQAVDDDRDVLLPVHPNGRDGAAVNPRDRDEVVVTGGQSEEKEFLVYVFRSRPSFDTIYYGLSSFIECDQIWRNFDTLENFY